METETFTCQGCLHELPLSYSLRTEGYCYYCDPNISLLELISPEPITPLRLAVKNAETHEAL